MSREEMDNIDPEKYTQTVNMILKKNKLYMYLPR